MKLQTLPRALAAICLFPTFGSSQVPRPVGQISPQAPTAVNRTPRITFEGAPPVVCGNDEVRFTVQVEDLDGDAVSLRLLNPRPGLMFEPVLGGPSPSTREIRWLVTHSNGIDRLVFEANDDRRPGARVRRSLEVLVRSPTSSGLLTGDVTGDGILDVVGTASVADPGGTSNAGAAYVWAGASTPSGTPTASLIVAGASPNDRISSLVQIVDLTGDGILDVLALSSSADIGGVQDTGALFLWKGGPQLAGTVSAAAILAVPGAQAQDRLGSVLGTPDGAGLGFSSADVTNDGIRDAIAITNYADVGGVQDVGAIYVWAGGNALSGMAPPSAALSVPGAVAGDRLGNLWGDEILIEDVTGDGVLDIVSGSVFADVAGVGDAGALYVWKGGASIASAPTATLTAPGASFSDLLGWNGVRFGDVGGDGTADVVVGTELAGPNDVGAVFVWKGGPALVGGVAPTATLKTPGAAPGDLLTRSGIRLHDVTGDGTCDVITGSPWVDLGAAQDAGALYAWEGGPGLVGTPSPCASLVYAAPASGDQLGGDPFYQPIQIEDVTGDGTVDVVTGSNVRGTFSVWAGGPGMAGSTSPTATLSVAGVNLGSFTGRNIRFEDVTGDQVLDLLTGSQWADPGGTTNAGELYVWAGGIGLTGTPAPTATLRVPGAVAEDRLGSTSASGQGILTADVTGDGVRDVIGVAMEADPGGIINAGALYVWRGGATMLGTPPPLASLSVPGASVFDQLTDVWFVGQGVLLGDVTSDGVLDIVAATSRATIGGIEAAGGVYVWKGGGTLAGPSAPAACLTLPGPTTDDRLGEVGRGQGFALADLTGDGRLDVLVGTKYADVAGVQDTGAFYLWKAPPTSAPPTTELSVRGAAPEDQLGS